MGDFDPTDDGVLEEVQRKVKPLKSDQPRFTDQMPNFGYYQYLVRENLQEPAYGANTRARDAWLAQVWRLEPHFAGVLASVVEIDKNRGWRMIGGRNQVRKFASVLFDSDENAGYRSYIGKKSLAYYTSDLGAISELGRMADNMTAPIAAVWNVDSTLCRVTGDPSEPLEYRPRLGEMQRWRPWDYMRLCSMPSAQESLLGVGFCALSRCLDLLKIMVAVFEHDKEQLGVDAPSGFLTISGISEQQWIEALATRKEQRENAGLRYYKDIMVLTNPAANIDLKLTAISNLPANFSLEDFIQILVQGYALAFGYDPHEFYSVKYQPLTNAGQAAAMQSKKASAKGELDFCLAFQSEFQKLLPDSISYEFDERSDDGDRLRAETKAAEAQVVINLYTAGLKELAPLISREEARQALVEAGVLPRELLGVDMSRLEVNDVMQYRSRAADNPSLRAGAALFPNDPIVMVNHLAFETVLFSDGAEMLERHSYPAARIPYTSQMIDVDDNIITETALERLELVTPAITSGEGS